MAYIKILDHPNLVRDTETRAVLNVNTLAKENFITAREKARKEKQRIDVLEENVAGLTDKLTSVENLLQKVLDRLS